MLRISACICIVVLGILYLPAHAQDRNNFEKLIPQLTIGSQAPTLKLRDWLNTSGEYGSLAFESDTIYLIELFASWSKPCRFRP